jgi:hypothetical protein
MSRSTYKNIYEGYLNNTGYNNRNIRERYGSCGSEPMPYVMNEIPVMENYTGYNNRNIRERYGSCGSEPMPYEMIENFKKFQDSNTPIIMQTTNKNNIVFNPLKDWKYLSSDIQKKIIELQGKMKNAAYSLVYNDTTEYSIEVDISSDGNSMRYFFFTDTGLMNTSGTINGITYKVFIKNGNNTRTDVVNDSNKVAKKIVNNDKLFITITKPSNNNSDIYGLITLYCKPSYSGGDFVNGRKTQPTKNDADVIKIDLFIGFLKVTDNTFIQHSEYIKNTLSPDIKNAITTKKTEINGFINKFRINATNYFQKVNSTKFDIILPEYKPALTDYVNFIDKTAKTCNLGNVIRSKWFNKKSEVCCFESKTSSEYCPFYANWFNKSNDMWYIESDINSSSFTIDNEKLKNYIEGIYPILKIYPQIYTHQSITF